MVLHWIFPFWRQSLNQFSHKLECGSYREGETYAHRWRSVYYFDAVGGDVVSLRLTDGFGSSGWDATLRVYDPSGDPVTGAQDEADVLIGPLTDAGRYTVTVGDEFAMSHGSFLLYTDWLAPRNMNCAPLLECGDVGTAKLQRQKKCSVFGRYNKAGDMFFSSRLSSTDMACVFLG